MISEEEGNIIEEREKFAEKLASLTTTQLRSLYRKTQASLKELMADEAAKYQTYQEALAIKDSSSVRLNLARLLLDSGKPDRAISQLQTLRNADY